MPKKASESKHGKLKINFSQKHGGPISIHYCSFIDEVAFQMRQQGQVGAKKWSNIPYEKCHER